MAEADTFSRSDKIEIDASEFRNVKLPLFWKTEPKLWFTMLEMEFDAYTVSQDAIKYSAVLRHLDDATMKTVADVIQEPPSEDSYKKIKAALIKRYSASEKTKLQQLMSGIELGDKKLSESSDSKEPDTKEVGVTTSALLTQVPSLRSMKETLKMTETADTSHIINVLNFGGADVMQNFGEEFEGAKLDFNFKIPSPVTKKYEPTETAVEEFVDQMWYPKMNSTDPAGVATREYVSILKKASGSLSECFDLIQKAEEISKRIECEKTKRLWVRLNPVIRFLIGIDRPDSCCDIANYLICSPSLVDVYIQGVLQLKPYVQKDTGKLTTLEEKLTNVKTSFDIMLNQYRAQIQTMSKMRGKVFNCLTNSAKIQNMLEEKIQKA